MGILHATGKKRETYFVEIKMSLLWECALGIAAVTNTPIKDTLERPERYWRNMEELNSIQLREHLNYVEKNNTWKALLQLLHEKDFKTLTEFITYINELSTEKLRFICLPFIGDAYQSLRERAACQEKEVISQLKDLTSDNTFFPRYIDFICNVDPQLLKEHLSLVMTGWLEEVITPNIENLEGILQADIDLKRKMKLKMNPEEFVEWATAGIDYSPEPSVHKVLLIPHYIYRPWNIVADIENTKVFYYPIANESVFPHDNYLPNNFLVLKYKALGDEVRLRIVKLLYEKSRTLQEITEQLNIGKSTIHHHLKLLRSAKLVEIQGSKYVLKRKSVMSLGKELDLYLHL